MILLLSVLLSASGAVLLDDPAAYVRFRGDGDRATVTLTVGEREAGSWKGVAWHWGLRQAIAAEQFPEGAGVAIETEGVLSPEMAMGVVSAAGRARAYFVSPPLLRASRSSRIELETSAQQLEVRVQSDGKKERTWTLPRNAPPAAFAALVAELPAGVRVLIRAPEAEDAEALQQALTGAGFGWSTGYGSGDFADLAEMIRQMTISRYEGKMESLAIAVRDGTGRPLANADVEVRAWCNDELRTFTHADCQGAVDGRLLLARGKTDAAGRLVATFVPVEEVVVIAIAGDRRVVEPVKMDEPPGQVVLHVAARASLLSVHVVDVRGRPIDGAEVGIHELSEGRGTSQIRDLVELPKSEFPSPENGYKRFETGPDGIFTFPLRKGGKFGIDVRAPAFLLGWGSATVPLGGSASLEVVLHDGAVLECEVRDESGATVADALVTADAVEEAVVESRIGLYTGPDGRARFDRLAPGSHRISVKAAGYPPAIEFDPPVAADGSRVILWIDRGTTRGQIKR